MDTPDVEADSQNCVESVRNGDGVKDVSSSTASASVETNPVSIDISNDVVEGIHEITLANKSDQDMHGAAQCVTKAALPVSTKDDMLVGEDGELDYDEDEGEEEKTDKQTAPEELEEGELEDEGEEGEILSGDETKSTQKKDDQEEGEINENDLEEGELREPGEFVNRAPKKLCRYYSSGSCTWGVACRFLHPGVNDKGAYHMLPQPGQYPSPFPKVSQAPPVVQETVNQVGTQDDEDEDKEDGESGLPAATENISTTPKRETAWERGLKRAKEIKKAALRRKEEDADFEQKRMSLGISADAEEDDVDKENTYKQRDLRLHMKKAKDSGDYEESSRYRRTRDDGHRWRDTRESPPYPRQDKDRRKRRSYRARSASPDRDKYSRNRTSGKERTREKTREKNKDKEKERAREKKSEEGEKKREERQSHRDKPEDKETTDNKKPKTAEVKIKEEPQKDKTEAPKDEVVKEKDKKSVEEATATAATTQGEQDKQGFLAISAARLTNDTWHDPWQRTTSPKRRLSRNSSTSSRSSRRSSSSSSGSSHSSRSRSDSDSRSSSRSPSRSQSRSISRSPSHSRSRSRSGSHSRSVSPSSASDRSSTPSSAGSAHEDSAADGEETRAKGPETPSDPSSVSTSGSGSASSRSPSPQKSPPAERQPTHAQTQKQVQTPAPTHTQTRGGASSAPSRESHPRERGNRYSYGRADRIDKWRHQQDNAWHRRSDRRGWEDTQRARGSRRGGSPPRGRRSRSPRRRDSERRRRHQESKNHRRSSSADSMEHALARPSSPRAARDHGNRSSASRRSHSKSSASASGQESEDESKTPRQQRLDRRGGTTAVLLSSGKIRYTGHKDIKLTLNKSTSKPKSPQPAASPGPAARPNTSRANERSDKSADKPSEKTVEKPVLLKKAAAREPSPPCPASTSISDEVPTSPKTLKRTADSLSDDSKADVSSSTSSRREELLRELKAVEDAIARKRARIE